MIWQTDSLTDAQRAIVRDADERSEFDFDRLLPGLQADQGAHRTGIPVEFVDLSRFQSSAQAAAEGNGHAHVHEGDDEAHLIADARSRVLGLAWYSGKVQVEQSLGAELAREVFLAEGAHMIDFFWMTDAQRGLIASSLHSDGNWQHDQHGWFEERGDQDYNDWPGEVFMDLFMLAATDVKPTMQMRWSHPITEHAIRATREVLSPGFKQKPIVAWGYKGRKLFHTHRHRKSDPDAPMIEKRYTSVEDAVADGRRLCYWCSRLSA